MPRRLGQLSTLLRQGRFSALARRVRDATATEALPLATETLVDALSDADEWHLVIDGSHAGGAKIASERLLRSLIAQGKPVLRMGSGVISGRLQLRFDDPVNGRLIQGSSRRWPSLPTCHLGRIYAESMAGFTQPHVMLAWLQGLLSSCDAPMTLRWHDHFALCPCPQALDRDGAWNGVPGPETHPDRLPSLERSLAKALGRFPIVAWRELWAPILRRAETIEVFSNSSLQLLSQGYDQSIATKVIVLPHSLDHLCDVSAPRRVRDDCLHVGIIGRINHHKGAGVLRELSAAIQHSGHDAKITLFGTLEELPRLPIEETGRYTPDTLLSMVHCSAVNVMLFPSIWPETFGFALHESLATGLPVLGFDLGAQGETLRGATNGRVLPLGMSGDELLTELRLAVGLS